MLFIYSSYKPEGIFMTVAINIGSLYNHNDLILAPDESPFAKGVRKECFAGFLVDKLSHHSASVALLRSHIAENDPRCISAKQYFLREIANLTFVNSHPLLSPFFVRFYGVCGSFLVCQRYTGTLQDIASKKIECTNTDRVLLMYQAFIGLEMLHAHNLAHLDIKPNNLFLSENTVVFGDVESLLNANHPLAQIHFGSFCFSPPETLVHLTPRRCTLRPDRVRVERDPRLRDVWALALTAYCVLTSQIPQWAIDLSKLNEYQLEEADRVIARIKSPVFPQPRNSVEIFLNCALQVNPDNRYTAGLLRYQLSCML
jgi:serine/threonine protein kinase